MSQNIKFGRIIHVGRLTNPTTGHLDLAHRVTDDTKISKIQLPGSQFRGSSKGITMASWNSTSLEIIYQVFGWTAFVSWSISFYPQVILNFRRKRFLFFFFWIFFLSYPSSSFVFSRDSSSYLLRIVGKRSVVGLNFDFVVLNLTKHSSYLIYNAVLYFSSAVQRQYREKYGIGQVCVFGFSFLHFLLIKKFLHYVSFLWS